MVAELSAAQEDALLEDVVDYLEEVSSEDGDAWADQSPVDDQSDPGQFLPASSRPPSARNSESGASSSAETGDNHEYRSPSGKIYATKVDH